MIYQTGVKRSRLILSNEELFIDTYEILVIGGIDLSQNKETEIQLQYIEKCKELLAKNSTKRPTFHIQNEGCQMNSIQTESIAAIMEKMGYEMVDTEDADAVVFNTCTVRENANQKIYEYDALPVLYYIIR